MLDNIVGIIAAAGAGGGPPPALTEVSSVKVLRDTLADPWDDTVNIAAGSNRILLSFIGASANKATDLTSCVLDPAGDNIALTALTGSPQGFSTTLMFAGFRLLNSAFPGTTGNKTLRKDWTATKRGATRSILLANASQTIFSAGAFHDANAALEISVTHPTATFPIGSFIYAGIHAEAGADVAYTVTGDVTEIDDDFLTVALDRWVFASGILGSEKATVSATFTRATGATVQKQGMIVVVTPL